MIVMNIRETIAGAIVVVVNVIIIIKNTGVGKVIVTMTAIIRSYS